MANRSICLTQAVIVQSPPTHSSWPWTCICQANAKAVLSHFAPLNYVADDTDAHTNTQTHMHTHAHTHRESLLGWK